MDREKLEKQIKESPLDNSTTDLLVKRLSVASNEGCAAVVRDFDKAMAAYRVKVLPSYRRFFGLGGPQTSNKQAFALNAK